MFRVLRDPVVPACALALLAMLVHLPVLGNDFVFDDVPAILENPLVTGQAPALDVFTTNFWGGRAGYDDITTWRPLTTLAFRGLHALSPGDPLPFHLAGLLVHGLVSALVFLLVRAWLGGVAGLFAGALFTVMPVHVEAVAAAVSLAELLAAASYIGALLCALRGIDSGSRRWYLAAIVLFAVALGCKEHAITWPAAAAVLFLHRWLAHRDAPKRSSAPRAPPVALGALLVLVVSGYLLARAAVLPSIFGGDVAADDNPLVESDDPLTRLSTGGKVYFHYLRLLVAPVRMSADYTAHALPIAESPMDADAFAGLALIALSLGALIAAWRRRRDVAACLVLFAVLYSPISNLVVLSTIFLAERLMYLPSLAACALAGLFAQGAWRAADGRSALTWLIGISAIMVVAGYGVRSTARVTDWRDPVTLFGSSVQAFPNSVRAHYNLGLALLARGALDRADSELTQVLLIDPTSTDAMTALGDARFRRGRHDEALELSKRAFFRAPNPARGFALCRSLVMTQGFEEAVRVCTAATRDNPRNARVRHYLAVAREELDRILDADRGSPVPSTQQ